MPSEAFSDACICKVLAKVHFTINKSFLVNFRCATQLSSIDAKLATFGFAFTREIWQSYLNG
jgi:hypothetical protein